ARYQISDRYFVNVAPLQLREKIVVGHWMSLRAGGKQNEVRNILNKQAAYTNPLQPALPGPTSQHRTNAQWQSVDLGPNPVVRLPSFKITAVKVGRERAHRPQC